MAGSLKTAEDVAMARRGIRQNNTLSAHKMLAVNNLQSISHNFIPSFHPSDAPPSVRSPCDKAPGCYLGLSMRGVLYNLGRAALRRINACF